MGRQLFAHICTNGHVISSISETSEIRSVKFCTKCSAPIISKCPSCSVNITGKYSDEMFGTTGQKYDRPAYCHNCGKPYPWTESALEAMKKIIWEDEDLFDDEKERMSQSLPDLLTETPKTDLAIMRVKKYAMRAAKEVGTAFLSFVIEHGCEKAVTALGALMS